MGYGVCVHPFPIPTMLDGQAKRLVLHRAVHLSFFAFPNFNQCYKFRLPHPYGCRLYPAPSQRMLA